MPYALFLFIVMPILEIALLLRVGDAFGWVPTLLIVIATALLGSAMLRQQGLATLAKARTRMDSGEMPAQQLLEGLLIMIGGVLLLTPGFVTDGFGFVCLIPVTRQWMAARLSARAMVGFSAAARGPTAAGGASPHGQTRGGRSGSSQSGTHGGTHSGTHGQTQRSANRRVDGDVIDGDFERLDD